MTRNSRVNRTGRSSGQPVPSIKKLLQAPKGEPWIWLSRELMESPAWRGMSINTHKFIDFLLVEHCSHGGQENGNLKATYDQLVKFGLTRKSIREAIAEGEALGLVRQKGPSIQRVPNRFRLTFYSTIFKDRMGGEPPTNDWRRVAENDIEAIHTKRRSIKQAKAAGRSQSRSQIHNPDRQSSTRLGAKGTSDRAQPQEAKTQKSAVSASGSLTTPSISGDGYSEKTSVTSTKQPHNQPDLFE
jgi:ribosomal protein S14